MLPLKEGILKDLNGKKFEKLSSSMQDRILEFDLWKIDIEEKNNINFDEIDLFVRLNYKPYPIQENTFEMWNSYIDREIISSIKEIYKRNENWFYFRKSNTRMDNETICTALSYLEYQLDGKEKNLTNIQKHLDIYKIRDRINFRIKSKNEITKILENGDKKKAFIIHCNEFEQKFIYKIKLLAPNRSGDETLERNLNYILNVERRRTQQSFYSLWVFLSNIDIAKIEPNKDAMKNDLRNLYISMSIVESKEKYLEQVLSFWEKYA
jgi:hypothetical protein